MSVLAFVRAFVIGSLVTWLAVQGVFSLHSNYILTKPFPCVPEQTCPKTPYASDVFQEPWLGFTCWFCGYGPTRSRLCRVLYLRAPSKASPVSTWFNLVWDATLGFPGEGPWAMPVRLCSKPTKIKAVPASMGLQTLKKDLDYNVPVLEKLPLETQQRAQKIFQGMLPLNTEGEKLGTMLLLYNKFQCSELDNLQRFSQLTADYQASAHAEALSLGMPSRTLLAMQLQLKARAIVDGYKTEARFYKDEMGEDLTDAEKEALLGGLRRRLDSELEAVWCPTEHWTGVVFDGCVQWISLLLFRQELLGAGSGSEES